MEVKCDRVSGITKCGNSNERVGQRGDNVGLARFCAEHGEQDFCSVGRVDNEVVVGKGSGNGVRGWMNVGDRGICSEIVA